MSAQEGEERIPVWGYLDTPHCIINTSYIPNTLSAVSSDDHLSYSGDHFDSFQ